ncbi:type II toxin-antitoxin system prevent-host-death family antitoxin [Sphingomonas sp. HF-S4]|uniref:Antitoxin n=1 Tax=Sphingomonas agrestis TaxID=3080540 RepID=A0ABU3YCX9_9SPHN|nr:type II toxin-antitoxin system prevent-host-death family antitoxin [Sphingomonas sp. HF-S4]MDV3459250.1 type II toxin-antitoxin system prevent-host-death family antitoxin [Sphingomonas sp. HF-S4]
MAEADPRNFVNVHDAKTNFSRLLDRAHAGEEIVLAKAGIPYAKLVPFNEPDKPKRRPGRWPELRNIPDSVWFDPLGEDELAAWEGKYSGAD